jgi:hypothetical protein
MSSYFKELKSLRLDVLSPAFHDYMRSMPDSIFLGSSLFALLTQNYPLGIFVLAMMEFGLAQRMFGSLFGFIQDNTKKPTSDLCIPGIPSPYQISAIGKLLSTTAFPSGPVFFMTAVFSYTIISIMNFSSELAELGLKDPEWKSRIPICLTFSTLFFIVYTGWRLIYSCETAPIILGSALFGALVGFLIQTVHLYLFGRDSINFLGLPLLADRAANGDPLYVCGKTN